MQSNSSNVWIISEDSFNSEGIGELIFSETINQTFIVSKHPGVEWKMGEAIMAAKIIGMVEYRDGGKIAGVSELVANILSASRRSRNSPIAPSRELTPGWVRPFDTEAIVATGGKVNMYDKSFVDCLWLGFIGGQSDFCQFSYHINRVGLRAGESWKPADVSSFQEDTLRRELENKIVGKKTEHYLNQIKHLRQDLAGLETLGSVPFIRLVNGDVIKFSEVELFFESFDPERYVGLTTSGENITRQEKRQLCALVNLIKDCKAGEEEYVGGIVDEEVARWKNEWKAGAEWLSRNIPFGSSVEKTELDTINHPIIETFIDVGMLYTSTMTVGREERIFVAPTSAGYTICSAVLIN